MSNPPVSEEILKVIQVLPDIEVHIYNPTIIIPNGLDEPKTMKGRLAVVLANHRRVSQTSIRRLRKLLEDHAWSSEGLEEMVDFYLRWEILTKKNGHLIINHKKIKLIHEPGDIIVE